MEASVTCTWMKADGTSCKNTRLVENSKYCYKHYWQALWAKTSLGEMRLPRKTNWIGLIVCILYILYWLIFPVRSPKWIFPDWLSALVIIVQEPSLVQNNPDLLLQMIGWFASGGAIVSSFWTGALMLCAFPLTPRFRRRNILIGLVSQGLFILLLLIATVALFFESNFIMSTWLRSGILGIAGFQWVVVVFWLADTLKQQMVQSIGLRSFATYIVTQLIISSALILLGGVDLDNLPVSRLMWAAFYLIIGIMLLRSGGRIIITEILTWQVATLADALRPVDALSLGFDSGATDARTRALRKALKLYANLTPMEQEELDIYVINKHKPSLAQIAAGVLSIILSAFFLEAPAQQAFIWFACHLLKSGGPFCP